MADSATCASRLGYGRIFRLWKARSDVTLGCGKVRRVQWIWGWKNFVIRVELRAGSAQNLALSAFGYPPFANCAKSGPPRVLVILTKSKSEGPGSRRISIAAFGTLRRDVGTFRLSPDSVQFSSFTEVRAEVTDFQIP